MGIAFGITETFNSLAQVLAPLLAGVLYTRNPVLVFIVALGLQCMPLLASTLLTRKKTGKATPLPRSLEP
jgi:MFS family permease